MKRTTRAFATGILFATTILAIIYYTNHKQLQPNKISEKQYEQLMAERNELAHALEKLKKRNEKSNSASKRNIHLYVDNR
ncbi:hypothetical protein [Anoxybacillus sp. KU2-6(11)]|uniref:hypothetical protein n=1 Tax=Anoxybacillus sp. KU2-6(11) TaxID=1535751 RepID=UPI000504FA6D|nr:hypothetical protein [Anoxybacillus sp. KU2-6(11)]KFZ42922.1 hypothetical protein JS80_06770 [Anoxybacillus sp. KU2-6(11)]